MNPRFLLAVAAKQGMLAHSTRYQPREGAPENWHEALAEEAFEIAEAMMKEAAKNPENLKAQQQTFQWVMY
jgi:hypothetical protein